ncbi:MAG: hemerythrin domain-containing protein [Myxococcales bacterium]|nr:hemerythrin domain-containing protein [Myxococcales bacterium]
MSVDIIDVLLGEHGMLNALFEQVERALPTATTREQLGWAIDTLEAGLTAHSGLEDKILIPAMERKIGQGGALAVMRDEHTELEDVLRMARLSDNVEEARELLKRVITLATRHFTKEEKFLFPLARHDLTGPERAEIGERWAELRCVTLAPRPGEPRRQRRPTYPPWGDITHSSGS